MAAGTVYGRAMRGIFRDRRRVVGVAAIAAAMTSAFALGMACQAWRTWATDSYGRSPHGRLGIRAEFNPQSALLLGANELVRFHPAVFTNLVRAVHERLPIVGFVNDEDERELGQQLLDAANLPEDAVAFVKHPLDSMWIRDFGPLFSRRANGVVEVIDAIYFNPDPRGQRGRDDAFVAYIGRRLGLRVRRMPLVVEGGNLLPNGDGLMVSSTRVLTRPRNSMLSPQQIGEMMQEYFGCRMWAHLRQLEGEPTGHADFCLAFLRRNLVVVGQYDADYDPVNAKVLDEIASLLRDQPTSMGPMCVERIPMPPRSKEGHWRSYCGVLFCNGIVLVPSYSDVNPATEEQALAVYRRLLPNEHIVPIGCDSLAPKRGVLHCIGIGVPGHVDVSRLLSDAL